MSLNAEKNTLVMPKHIGFIMDGNRRWARNRHLPIVAGHRAGGKAFRDIIKYCKKLDIKAVTVYAFSTENWKRSQEEVSDIMDVFVENLEEWFIVKKREDIRFRFIGDWTPLSDKSKDLMKKIEEGSKMHENIVNVAINYGARAEITRAFNNLLMDGKKEITEKDISGAIYTYDYPDVDLIVRTGGDVRLSNFLLWQAAYSEFYFTDVLWPDMNNKEIDKAIEYFNKCNRRFGGN